MLFDPAASLCHGENGGGLLKMNKIMWMALGANLTSSVGGPADTLRAALKCLEIQGAVIRTVSSFYSTPAFPTGKGPDYVNAVAEISADWSASEALAHMHAIEAQMGRERGVRWGQRTLDLDLIGHGDLVLPDAQTHAEWRNLPLDQQMTRSPDQLILPHPRLQDRAFVLVPMADVAPDWVHPVLCKSVQELLNTLPKAQRDEVKAIKDTI